MTSERSAASPRFSIITPVYNTPLDVFRDTVASVLSQTFTDWEWILADDRSPNPDLLRELRRLAALDPRIVLVERPENGGIVAASNSCLGVARGEFAVLLDHDDLLVDVALERVAAALDRDAEIDYLYTDEDKLYPDGSFRDVFRKPAWSPERLRNQMYTSHLSALRLDLVRSVGGFHAGFDGSQDHDLVLRVTERARRVHHLPEVLYHWRIIPGSAAGDPEAKPYAWDAGLRAIEAHLERTEIKATAERGPGPGHYRVVREPDLATPVSVIIPTGGSTGVVWGERRLFVEEAIASIVRTTSHRDYEFVVVIDEGTDPAVAARVRELHARVTVVESTGAFNFSSKCNTGAILARGEILVFVNDDTETSMPGALEQLIAPLRESDVGMTGPRLLRSDLTHQHAGIVYGDGLIANGHTGRPHPVGHPGYFADLWINREVSALTAAYCALRAEDFFEVGGFCEELPLNFNDVDLSMKLRGLGRRLVWLHEVSAFHFESRSRVPAHEQWETEFVRARWGSNPGPDRYALRY